MKYQEALLYIKSIHNEVVPGLDNMRNLCAELLNPQDELWFIHIAGTNGKGSVLAFVSTVLARAGYRVGRYISPTIVEYRERFQINEKMISKRDLGVYVEKVRDACEVMADKGMKKPTPFEFETALAFLYFRDKKCDIVVLETGMGGALDATNIINNTLVSVLTPISMDHMRFLGKSIEDIADTKTGILKKGAKVVSAEQSESVMQIIRSKAAHMGLDLQAVETSDICSVLYGLQKQSFSYKKYKKVCITLSGTHQIGNAALAIEVIEAVKEKGMIVSDQALYDGMKDTNWFGRFTQIHKHPLFIIDGAHNEAAAVSLANSIQTYVKSKRIIFIMGVLRDKECDKIIEKTYKLAESILTIKPPLNERAMEAYELACVVSKYHNNVTSLDSLEEAVELSLLMADKNTVIVAFGSLSFLGEISDIVQNKQNLRRDYHGR